MEHLLCCDDWRPRKKKPDTTVRLECLVAPVGGRCASCLARPNKTGKAQREGTSLHRSREQSQTYAGATRLQQCGRPHVRYAYRGDLTHARTASTASYAEAALPSSLPLAGLGDEKVAKHLNALRIPEFLGIDEVTLEFGQLGSLHDLHEIGVVADEIVR